MLARSFLKKICVILVVIMAISNNVFVVFSSDKLPTAHRVYIKGAEVVGTSLTGFYWYNDEEGRAESGTTFKWLRSDDKDGNYEYIPEAYDKNYTISDQDTGKYIKVEVTPKSGDVTGIPVKSFIPIGPVITKDQSNSMLNYFDNKNPYEDNLFKIQEAIKERLKDAIVFCAGNEKYSASDAFLIKNQKNTFTKEQKPILSGDTVLLPEKFVTDLMKEDIKFSEDKSFSTISFNGISASNVQVQQMDGICYFPLKQIVEAAGKKLWDGNSNQSTLPQGGHKGEGLIVISDNEKIFDPDKDKDLINETCNMLYTLRATPEQMQWFRDAKFGLFIHWDPSSVGGFEISWGRKGGKPADVGTNPPETWDNSDPAYDYLYRQFNPVNFNPDEWMQIAKEAGMKYIVFTTKHHNGFSNFVTKYSEYSIKNTPYQKDIVKEIADAAHKAGLKVGWYYSPRDWYQPYYLRENHERYMDFYYGQLEELLTNYGQVDMLWFDSIGRSSYNQWDPRTFLRRIKQLAPDIIVNDRMAAALTGYGNQPYDFNGDFRTPEQKIGSFDDMRPWESCMTIDASKGWSWSEKAKAKTFEECMSNLISAITGDGNLLLDLGPKPDGTLMDDQVEVLKKMGKWLDKYGESIYGTRGGPFVTPVWGGSTYRNNEDGTSSVYLHITKKPSGNYLQLEDIGKSFEGGILLSNGKAIDIQKNDKGYLITLPEGESWDELDTVIYLKQNNSNISSDQIARDNLSKTVLETFERGTVMMVGSRNAYSGGKKVLIDGQNDKVSPIVSDGTVMVPAEFVSKIVGASLDWKQGKADITVKNGKKNIAMQLGSKDVTIDGKIDQIDYEPQVLAGNLMISLQTVEKVFGKKVFWDERGLIVISNVAMLDKVRDKSAIDEMIGEF